MAKKPSVDKESMFQKIMPSAATPAPAPEALPFSPDELQPAPSRPGGGAILRDGGVPIRGSQEQVLVNIMEQLVVERLDAALAKFNCCKCDKCRKDAAALALNKLAPKYVVAGRDNLAAYASLVSSSDVTTAIVQAVLQVRANPRH